MLGEDSGDRAAKPCAHQGVIGTLAGGTGAVPGPLALIGDGGGVYTDELSIALDSRVVLQAKKISTIVSIHLRILSEATPQTNET
jgi:hypothetical protein